MRIGGRGIQSRMTSCLKIYSHQVVKKRGKTRTINIMNSRLPRNRVRLALEVCMERLMIDENKGLKEKRTQCQSCTHAQDTIIFILLIAECLMSQCERGDHQGGTWVIVARFSRWTLGWTSLMIATRLSRTFR